VSSLLCSMSSKTDKNDLMGVDGHDAERASNVGLSACFWPLEGHRSYYILPAPAIEIGRKAAVLKTIQHNALNQRRES